MARVAGGSLRRRPVVPIEPLTIERIRELMAAAGEGGAPITQQQLVDRARARGATMSRATLNRVLMGKAEPKYDTLHAIALGLGTSLSELLPRAAASADLDGYVRLARQEAGIMVATSRELEPEVAPGDLLVVERTSLPEPGELVAVHDPSANGQVRFMRAYPEVGERYMFQAARQYIYGDRSLVIGRVVLVMHRPPMKLRSHHILPELQQQLASTQPETKRAARR
jgi:transcriptional regulator with XRE-family HTH domain